MAVKIKAVRCYGDGLRVFTDATGEVLVTEDTVTADRVYAGFNGGISIDFDNGLSLYVGDDGYPPTKAWLTKDGEPVVWPIDLVTEIIIPLTSEEVR